MAKENIILIVAILGVFAFVVFCVINYKVTVLNRPEQHEHVEIIGKRTVDNNTDGNIYNDYFVTFRFPVGTDKEFDMSDTSTEFLVGKATHEAKEIYDSMHEGDTGIINYKESKDANNYYDRKFISFEKDPQLDT